MNSTKLFFEPRLACLAVSHINHSLQGFQCLYETYHKYMAHSVQFVLIHLISRKCLILKNVLDI